MGRRGLVGRNSPQGEGFTEGVSAEQRLEEGEGERKSSIDIHRGRMGIASAKALGQEWAWSITGWLEHSQQGGPWWQKR